MSDTATAQLRAALVVLFRRQCLLHVSATDVPSASAVLADAFSVKTCGFDYRCWAHWNQPSANSAETPRKRCHQMLLVLHADHCGGKEDWNRVINQVVRDWMDSLCASFAAVCASAVEEAYSPEFARAVQTRLIFAKPPCSLESTFVVCNRIAAGCFTNDAQQQRVKCDLESFLAVLRKNAYAALVSTECVRYSNEILVDTIRRACIGVAAAVTSDYRTSDQGLQQETTSIAALLQTDILTHSDDWSCCCADKNAPLPCDAHAADHREWLFFGSALFDVRLVGQWVTEASEQMMQTPSAVHPVQLSPPRCTNGNAVQRVVASGIDNAVTAVPELLQALQVSFDACCLHIVQGINNQAKHCGKRTQPTVPKHKKNEQACSATKATKAVRAPKRLRPNKEIVPEKPEEQLEMVDATKPACAVQSLREVADLTGSTSTKRRKIARVERYVAVDIVPKRQRCLPCQSGPVLPQDTSRDFTNQQSSKRRQAAVPVTALIGKCSKHPKGSKTRGFCNCAKAKQIAKMHNKQNEAI